MKERRLLPRLLPVAPLKTATPQFAARRVKRHRTMAARVARSQKMVPHAAINKISKMNKQTQVNPASVQVDVTLQASIYSHVLAHAEASGFFVPQDVVCSAGA